MVSLTGTSKRISKEQIIALGTKIGQNAFKEKYLSVCMAYVALVSYLSLVSCISPPNVDPSSSNPLGTLESTVLSSSSAQAAPAPPSTPAPVPAVPDPIYQTKALDLTANILNGNCHENEPLPVLFYNARSPQGTVRKSFSVYENGMLTTALAEGEKSPNLTPSSLYVMLCPTPYTLSDLFQGHCDDRVVEIHDYEIDGIPNAGIISSAVESFSYGHRIYSRDLNDSFDYQLLYQHLLDAFTSSCENPPPQKDIVLSQQ